MIIQKRSIILVLWISVLVCITLLSIACPAGPQVFHTVTFESNGGSVVDDITDVAHGTRIVAPADPTFEGRVFAGWFRDQALHVAWNFAVDSVGADITLYAKWTMITYTVSFDTDEGSAVDDIVDIPHNAAIGQPLNPTKPGWVFAGWYKEDTLTTLWDFAVDTVVENLTLYAKWTVATYTVSFDTDEGSAVGDITGVAHGTTIDEPVDPTKEGHTFDAWYKEDTLTTLWDFAVDTVVENLTLYAKWTVATTYTVTFNCNGGSAVDAITGVLLNATITEPDDPTWTYRLFWGWYTDPSLNSWFKWDFAVDEVTDDITLYANWTFGGTGPGGGLVFYENANYVADGWRYLEAAPKSEERDSLRWTPVGSSVSEVGGTETAIGTGQANTTAILNAMGGGTYAAKYCTDLIYGTKDDWFLPSIDEAKAMRDNLYCDYVGGFTNDNYWSSTELGEYSVLCLKFDYGTQTSVNPGSTDPRIYVRPIRAF